MTEHVHRIVILGGGFAGFTAARELEARLTREERARTEITLVSRDNYFVFHPLLPEAVSGAVSPLHVIVPMRPLLRRTRLVVRDVESVDAVRCAVRLAPGATARALELEYDTLVIALGTKLDTSRTPGAAEHGLGFRTLADALRLRNRLVRRLEEAESETDPTLRRELLTFVVAGGGFSGVECAAEMEDLLSDAVRRYRTLKRDDIRIVLLQYGERILPELTESLAAFAHQRLTRRGIEIRVGTGLVAMSATQVVCENRATRACDTIGARTCVATVPAAAHELVGRIDVVKERGRIVTDACLTVSGRENIFAIGDCAVVRTKTGVAPPTAQHALRQAATCARNVLARLRGAPMRAHAFEGLGKLGSLGRRNAVAEVFGVRLSGVAAWLLWRAVYTAKLPGWERRLRLLADWTLDAVLPRNVAGLRLFTPPDVRREHFESGDNVVREGEVGDRLFVVVRGEAHVSRGGVPIAVVGPGSVVGEGALLVDRPRDATVRAHGPLDVVSMTRGSFAELRGRLPGFGGEIEEISMMRTGEIHLTSQGA